MVPILVYYDKDKWLVMAAILVYYNKWPLMAQFLVYYYIWWLNNTDIFLWKIKRIGIKRCK